MTSVAIGPHLQVQHQPCQEHNREILSVKCAERHIWAVQPFTCIWRSSINRARERVLVRKFHQESEAEEDQGRIRSSKEATIIRNWIRQEKCSWELRIEVVVHLTQCIVSSIVLSYCSPESTKSQKITRCTNTSTPTHLKLRQNRCLVRSRILRKKMRRMLMRHERLDWRSLSLTFRVKSKS